MYVDAVVGGGFLAGLSVDERAGFESLGRRRTFSSGQVLFTEGDEGRDVIVLLDGSVKIVSAAPSGREVILEVIDGGELVGEMSAIDGQPRSATAVALTAVDILVIPTPQFLSFLEEHGSAATALLRLVVTRLRHSSRRQLEFGTSDALGRLCACMLRMLDRYGGTDDRGAHVTMPLAQHEIAAMTGLSREAVVKGLRSLRALGWIDLQARELTVLDYDAMQSRATS
jgi:CRP/FNR family transcriptional regulator, cyclic AMP receptor protein